MDKSRTSEKEGNRKKQKIKSRKFEKAGNQKKSWVTEKVDNQRNRFFKY